jgi:hypothetical protein
MADLDATWMDEESPPYPMVGLFYFAGLNGIYSSASLPNKIRKPA